MNALVVLVVATLVAQTAHGNLDTDADQPTLTCGLYLAPSSNPRRTSADSFSQWGMYAGKDYSKNDAIGSPDVAINLHALRAHNTEDPDEDEVEHDYLLAIADSLIHNTWQPAIAGAGDEFDEEDSGAVIIPGAGLLADFNTKSDNAYFDVRASYQRVTVGEAPGQAHPGRGATSPFYNQILLATKDVKPGDEIILNYGTVNDEHDKEEEEDDDDDDEVDTLGQEDYTRIDQTVDQLLEFFQKHDQAVDESGKLQIYRFMTDDFLEAAVGPVKAKLIEALLPAHPSGLAYVKKAGGIEKYSQTSKLTAARSKPLEWLAANGMCMDNIRAGPSNIPNAGRGAFANRKIQQGGLVAPTPLLLTDKLTLNMYELAEDENGVMYRQEDQLLRGKQLLMNYIYSHPESTMGFIPMGSNVNLINHSPEPNARMQWSKHPLHTDKYFKVSPSELLHDQSIGLVIDIVALRDIAEGEEITINYGKRWKDAWDEHAKKYVNELTGKQVAGTWPLRASDLNTELEKEHLRTEDEQQSNPYPSGILLKVFAMSNDNGSLGDGSKENPYIFSEPNDQTLYTSSVLVEPIILERTDNGASGGKVLYTLKYEDTTTGTAMYLRNVPQHAFVFVDDEETGDQFTNNAFRHYIELPDDVFPQGPWRNLA